MANRYTDVDLMILKRWDEVKALRQAFNDLLERIEDFVEASLQKVTTIASERGLSSVSYPKMPTISFWKSEWVTRKKEEGIYFLVQDFVPPECGKAVKDYPSMWLMTDEFSKLKMRESSEDFGRALRAALSPELLTKWSHKDVDLSESPLGRDCTDVSESDRVLLVAEPDTLVKFIIERMDEFMELVPAIDQTLQKMTRR
jgi:hypothetical protein